MAEHRTKLEVEADKLDKQIFDAMDRADSMARDFPAHKDRLLKLADELAGLRAGPRLLMHQSDRAATNPSHRSSPTQEPKDD